METRSRPKSHNPKWQVMSHSPSPTAEAEDMNESVNANIHTLCEGQEQPTRLTTREDDNSLSPHWPQGSKKAGPAQSPPPLLH